MENPAVIIGVVSVTLTAAMFMAGVVYQLGRFAARLESLEGWRGDVKRDFDLIYALLRDIDHKVSDGRKE